MRKPKNKELKGPIYLTAYESEVDGETFKTVEASITKHCELNSKRLRAVANWMLETADWMESEVQEYRCSCCDEIKPDTDEAYVSWDQRKKPENTEVCVICNKCDKAMKRAGYKGLLQYHNFLDNKKDFYTLKELKEIVTDPMRVLFEALRYEEDKDILKAIVSDIEEGITANMKADELTELNIFEYLGIINDPDCKSWREDFINEMIDMVNDPQPDNDLITARRLLYDYINLPSDDIETLLTASGLIKNKKDKKIIGEYVSSYENDEKIDLDGLGEIILKLYHKFPARV